MSIAAFSPLGYAIADGAELLVYDPRNESPRWRRPLHAPLVCVAASGTAIASLEANGQAAAWDQAGMYLGGAAHAGARCVAASPSGGLALATPGAVVLVDASGERPIPLGGATALAFSRDGRVLGAGFGDGALLFFDAASGAGTGRSHVEGGAVTAIAERVPGEWIATAGDALFAVASGGGAVRRVTGMSGKPLLDVAASSTGALFALLIGDRLAVVLEWETRETAANFTYMDKTAHGVAFGFEDDLWVALNGGDANRVPLRSGQVCRTDPHPGRPRNRWMLKANVEGPIIARALR